MKKWARVGMNIEVDEFLWRIDPQRAVLQAFKDGRVVLDGETYFPGEADENDGTEPDMELYGRVILKGE